MPKRYGKYQYTSITGKGAQPYRFLSQKNAFLRAPWGLLNPAALSLGTKQSVRAENMVVGKMDCRVELMMR